MDKKRKWMFLICGALIVAITVIFYLLTFKNIFALPMRWISLTMLLIAEGLVTIKAVTIKDSIFKVANIITSVVHIIVVLILSIVFVNLMPLFVGKYILFNVLGLAILAIVDVLIIYISGELQGKSQETKINQNIMRTIYVKAQSLSINCQVESCSLDIGKIAQMLKYSDDTVLSGDETAIMSALDELNQISDEEEMKKKIEDIRKMIEFRTIKVKELQRGSF